MSAVPVLFLSLFSLLILSSSALACPSVEGIPDFNCDGSVKIAVLGDSLVSGVGDTKNKGRGGYILRTQGRFNSVEIINLGVPGLRSLQAISQITAAFRTPASFPKLYGALTEADVVILDLGRNDRWLFLPPSNTVRNLKRIADLIRARVNAVTGVPPFVASAVLMLPNRGSQGPWVKELNVELLAQSATGLLAELRFDLVSKRLLSPDQIHPTSAGYAALTKVFLNYLKNRLPARLRALRPDLDSDGVFDLFERTKYNTDPASADTDGDGVNDGAEIFVFGTDPLTPPSP